MAVIQLREVTRRFGDVTAVDGVTLDVEEGEIVGLLGHNGAGKTTLMRLINGLLRPDGGGIRVVGVDPTQRGHEVRRLTGVLTEYPALEGYLSPRENLQTYAAINGVDHGAATERITHLLDRLGLSTKADEACRDLSAGLKQRVALARALMHQPAVLLLDEPTTNMDPVAAREVRTLVSEAARSNGQTVLLSTHNLAEAESLCDRVAIMRAGRLLRSGAPDELRRDLGTAEHVRITTDPERSKSLQEGLAPRWLVTPLDAATMEVRRAVSNGAPLAVADIVAHLAARSVPIHRVEPVEPTLEDLYVALHADDPGVGPGPGPGEFLAEKPTGGRA